MIQDCGLQVNRALDYAADKTQEGVLVFVSDFDSTSDDLAARPINLKNAFTNLCQKISKKPTRLAMPEVMVIT
jgi:hypothetical protein